MAVTGLMTCETPLWFRFMCSYAPVQQDPLCSSVMVRSLPGRPQIRVQNGRQDYVKFLPGTILYALHLMLEYFIVFSSLSRHSSFSTFLAFVVGPSQPCDP